MIVAEKYLEVVKTYFNYLFIEFNFKLSHEKIKGNTFYDIQYSNGKLTISISYENIQDFLQIVIFTIFNEELPDYDDNTKSLHLNKLNAQIMPSINKDEISLNNQYFLSYKPTNNLERQLLKSAKELRLCLKHFNDIKLLK